MLMGRNSFWFTYGNKGDKSKSSVENMSKSVNTQKPKMKKETLLEMRLNSLLEKYKNNPQIKLDILQEVELFNINRAVALELKDYQAEKNLFRKINNYLNRY